MPLHDTHFHLDLFRDPIEMVRKIESSKIYTIAVTNSPTVFFHTKRITEGCKYIKPATGLHPELAYERRNEINKLIELLDETRYVGEVGLDNLNKPPVDYENQKIIFNRLLQACSDKGGKILTVHSRRASKDVISMIGEDFPGKIILHWYSGGLKELEQALNFGFYFSINYSMTKSLSGRKIIEALPLNRILIESDGPFIEFNKMPSTPQNCEVIAKEICAIRSLVGKKSTVTNIYENFTTLIS